MATSTTNDFNLDIAEAAEEAFELAGLEMRTGYDLRTARRSIDLMMLEWANRGLNLWQVESGSTTLTAGTATYTLDADTIDLLEHHLRTDDGNSDSQSDTELTRVSFSTYAGIPNKLDQGRPNEILINRNAGSTTFTLYPVPDNAQTYKVVWYRLRQIYDAGTPASNNLDIPKLFLPCLVSGLAYYIAQKNPEAFQRVPFLKQQYEEQWKLAADENRVKASVRFVPGGYN
jgi:hypothetical protein|tara:strand:- start:132 stop:821 length:690 start_codon:yes stop_codon:yes gene_type:complete